MNGQARDLRFSSISCADEFVLIHEVNNAGMLESVREALASLTDSRYQTLIRFGSAPAGRYGQRGSGYPDLYPCEPDLADRQFCR